ncbi:hypothetical protein QCD79_32350, partial [Pseudomonas quasicaspiana]|nr:hypothetical protein [Pseudomonas quasicaspiana]
MGAGLGLGGIPTMNDNAVCLTDRSENFRRISQAHRVIVHRRNAAQTKPSSHKQRNPCRSALARDA